jgi:hypothetical protein
MRREKSDEPEKARRCLDDHKATHNQDIGLFSTSGTLIEHPGVRLIKRRNCW